MSRSPPPFPVEVLPEPLRAFVQERAETTGIDPASIAWSALSACSAALDGSNQLEMKEFRSRLSGSHRSLGVVVRPTIYPKTPCLIWRRPSYWRVPTRIRHNGRRLSAHRTARIRRRAGDQEPQQRRLMPLATQQWRLCRISLDRSIVGSLSCKTVFCGLHRADGQRATHGRGSALDRAFYLKGWDGGPVHGQSSRPRFREYGKLPHCAMWRQLQQNRSGRAWRQPQLMTACCSALYPILVAKPGAGEDRPRARRVCGGPRNADRASDESVPGAAFSDIERRRPSHTRTD